MINGIIVVKKPQNFTSFDVVAVMRGCLHTKKVGHGGTLDPMATGILPVFAGSAAKAVSLLPDSDKSYRAGFRLGITSDTLDIWGNCSEQKDVRVSSERLVGTLKKFTGSVKQIPPMYSAVKIGGKKLCDLARQGVEVERQPRSVTISRIELTGFDGSDGEIEVDCSSGTYIRSLIDDIGAALGTGAVMTALERTRACGFTEGIPLEELRNMPYERVLEELLPIESVFGCYPAVYLNEIQKKLYLNGVRLDTNRISGCPAPNTVCRVYADKFIGIARITDSELVSIKRFI